MPSFSEKSKFKLNTCHPDLIRLFNEVIRYWDCTILDGYRNADTQDEMFERGVSKATFPNSNHNSYPSRAVDVMPYPIDWEDRERLMRFAGFVEGTAVQLGIHIRWGGDFNNFFDGPHYELDESVSQPDY